MNRIGHLFLGVFLAGLALKAGAEQSAPSVAPAPPSLVGTLAAHQNWPAAKDPSDVDTVDHLVASLYEVIPGPPASRATGTASARCFWQMAGLA